MSTVGEQNYFVIPLSYQKEEDFYLVGNGDIGDFYQFPEKGTRILKMLESGETAATIRSRFAAEYPETVDVDDFINQLLTIGFIYPAEKRQSVLERLEATARDGRRTFSVNPRTARAVFAPPVLACCLAVVLYAVVSAMIDPDLRINFNAFYTETNRTVLLLLVLLLSIAQAALHEMGHMLAAARHGIRSKYGVGSRLWTIVAESDLTGILSLPKSQRYFPMLAGLLVDILCASLLTILIKVLRWCGAGAFSIQVLQALTLEVVVSMPWQLNIFMKTDIYFVVCNYFGQPDLDRDARVYLRNLIYRATWHMFGSKTQVRDFRNVNILRIFSLIWLSGRILSFLVLFGVFLPTMVEYIVSAVRMLAGPPTSVWAACDTLAYVSITLTMLGTGLYMWLMRRSPDQLANGETNASSV